MYLKYATYAKVISRSVLLSEKNIQNIVTARVAKVMFPQACVTHSVHRGLRLQEGRLPPPSRKADTPPPHTHTGRQSPQEAENQQIWSMCGWYEVSKGYVFTGVCPGGKSGPGHNTPPPPLLGTRSQHPPGTRSQTPPPWDQVTTPPPPPRTMRRWLVRILLEWILVYWIFTE